MSRRFFILGVVAFSVLSTGAFAQTNTPSSGQTASTPNAFRVNLRGLRVSSEPLAPAPALTKLASVSSAALVFDAQPLGGAQTKSVLVINGGTGLLTLEAPQVQGAAFFSTSSCGSSLAAGQSCSVSVTFNATSSSPQSGVLTIVSDAVNGPLSVSLSGSVLAAPWTWAQDGNVTLNGDGSVTVAPLSTARASRTLPATGQWYWEMTSMEGGSFAGYPIFGVSTTLAGYPGRHAQNCGLYAYREQNYVEDNGVERRVIDGGGTWTVGVAYTPATRTAVFYRGGVEVGSCVVEGSAPVYPSAGTGASGVIATFTLNANPATRPVGYSALAGAP